MNRILERKWDRNYSILSFFLSFFSCITTLKKVKKNLSILSRQSWRKGKRFIFEKFGWIVRRCLATGAFGKRTGMKGEK